MKTKKYMKLKVFIALFLGFIAVGWAQKPDYKEKIKTMKIAYITDHLGLTPEQAEKFWPVYNKYDERIFELHHEERKIVKHQLNEESIEKLSEEEAQQLIDRLIYLENELLKQHKQMNADLKKILSAKEIVLLKKIEDDFMRELLWKLKGKKDKGAKH